ncbi:MAG: hypothetical protein ACKV0T_24980 [Planctomycetales bacterium]
MIVEVDSPLGKLPCIGVTGDQEFDQGNGSTHVMFENRLHEKSPFGVVRAVWKTERKMNGQVAGTGVTTITLVETGTTALSDLADKN